MNKRTMLIAGASLGAATAAIAGGAMISSSAMAASADGGVTATLTVIRAVDGQDPIRCTFDDVELPGAPVLVGTAGAVGTDGGPTFSVGIGGLEMTDAVGEGGGVQTAGQVILATDGVVPGDVGKLPPPPDGATVISSDDVRDGTPEECAAMRADMPAPPAGQPGSAATESGTATATP